MLKIWRFKQRFGIIWQNKDKKIEKLIRKKYKIENIENNWTKCVESKKEIRKNIKY